MSEKAYKDFLEGAIHRGVDQSEGASLQLRFQKTTEGQMQEFEVTRSWRVGARGVEEFLDISRNGLPAPELANHWSDYVESILPNGIAHLFFFDAEQIKELAEGENAKEMLRTAIHSLLGLDLVKRLENDLQVLERRKRKDCEDPELIAKANQADQEVDRLCEELAALTNETVSARKRAKLLGEEAEKKAKEFRQAGGELFEKREELERQEKDLLQKIHGEEEALRHLAAGPAPFLLVESSLQELESFLNEEEETKRSKILLKELATRDAQMLDAFSKWSRASKSKNQLEEWLAEDLAKREKAASKPLEFDADSLLLNDIRHLRSQAMPKIREETMRHLDRLNRYRSELEQIDRELGRVPDEKAIAELQIEFNSVQKESERAKQDLAALEARMSSLGGRLEEAENRSDLANRRVAELGFREEDSQRVVAYSQKTRETLIRFREKVTFKHVEKIEQLMLESFRQLLRKQHLVTDLQINPETFELTLKGADGSELPFERLSAGERQLLATSLLWGLARAAGRPIPTVIDTPLGRLDSSHRKHLVERYFPVASHQVILLSTDEEIHETNLGRLSPFVSRSYELIHHETLRRTTIQKGYFWNHEALC
jgi:DNA sulfur modification protein DndD